MMESKRPRTLRPKVEMRRVLLAAVAVWMCVADGTSEARRESFSEDQRTALAQIDRVLIEALALTDKGEVDASAIAQLTATRMSELGYTTLLDPSQPYDAILRVKCEQRKVWQGTIRSGGDADLPDSPSRTWKGPACQLRYSLGDKPMTWAKEVRTDFADAIKAAEEAKADDPGAFAITKLQERLAAYDFPIYLATEWGQDDRLLKRLDDPGIPPARKARMIWALGQLFSDPAVPRLQELVKDPNAEVATAAVIALGNIGHKDSIATLLDVLEHGTPELRVAAARGLGKVGALHGNPTIVPPLLKALETDDIQLQTEVVWALGQIPDRRSYEPLLKLQRSLRNVRTSDRNSPEGKLWDAVNYSMKQLDGFDQIN